VLYSDRRTELWPSVLPADRRTRVGFYSARKIMQKQALVRRDKRRINATFCSTESTVQEHLSVKFKLREKRHS
jgi:hypothetical protein